MGEADWCAGAHRGGYGDAEQSLSVEGGRGGGGRSTGRQKVAEGARNASGVVLDDVGRSRAEAAAAGEAEGRFGGSRWGDAREEQVVAEVLLPGWRRGIAVTPRVASAPTAASVTASVPAAVSAVAEVTARTRHLDPPPLEPGCGR